MCTPRRKCTDLVYFFPVQRGANRRDCHSGLDTHQASCLVIYANGDAGQRSRSRESFRSGRNPNPVLMNQPGKQYEGRQTLPPRATAPVVGMVGSGSERRLVISSRLAHGYELTAIGLKNLQHVFTVWFPRAVYYDLTDDTVRVDIVVRRGWATGRGVFATSFLGADGSLIKKVVYDEDQFLGKVCENYDQTRSGYFGKKDGSDYRIVVYATRPATADPR